MSRRNAITAGGIYVIRCSSNGRVYVGNAKAINARWNGHTSALKRGIHPCRELQKDWDLYGERMFSVEMLQECEDKEERKRLEPGWIAKLEATNPLKGYNISIMGTGRNLLSAEERLDHVLKLRLNSGLKAVMLHCAQEDGYETLSDWVRGMIQDRCDRELKQPEQFKLNF